MFSQWRNSKLPIPIVAQKHFFFIIIFCAHAFEGQSVKLGQCILDMAAGAKTARS